jgi:uncharacterized protein YeeX (DUF496 family)
VTSHQVAVRNRAIILFITAGGSLVVGLILHDWQKPGNENGPAVAAYCLAAVSFLIACYFFYDSLEIPVEHIDPPARVVIDRSEPWRVLQQPEKKYRVRYIENLLEQLTALEKTVEQSHSKQNDLYKELRNPTKGRAAYSSDRDSYSFVESAKQLAAGEIPKLKQRITFLVDGDFSAEVYDLTMEVEKLKRDRAEHERKVRDGEARVLACRTPLKDCSNCKDWPSQREDLYRKIHNLDHRVIELNSSIAELRSYDVKKLQSQLNLGGPERVATIPQEDLDKFKKSLNTVNELPTVKDRTAKQNPPEASPQNARDLARERRDLEIEHLTRAIASTERDYRSQMDRTTSPIEKKRLQNELHERLKSLRDRKFALETTL